MRLRREELRVSGSVGFSHSSAIQSGGLQCGRHGPFHPHYSRRGCKPLQWQHDEDPRTAHPEVRSRSAAVSPELRAAGGERHQLRLPADDHDAEPDRVELRPGQRDGFVPAWMGHRGRRRGFSVFAGLSVLWVLLSARLAGDVQIHLEPRRALRVADSGNGTVQPGELVQSQCQVAAGCAGVSQP